MTLVVAIFVVAVFVVVFVAAASFAWLVIRFGLSLPERADELRDLVVGLRADLDELREDVDKHYGEMQTQYEQEAAADQHLVDQVYEAEERVKALEGRFRGTLSKLAATGIVDLCEETR